MAITDTRRQGGDASRMSRRAFLGATALTVLSACTGGAGGQGSDPAPSSGSLFYGASMPKPGVAAFEASINARLSCHRSFFVPGQEAGLVSQAGNDLRSGRLPIVSIKPPGDWAATAKNVQWLDGLMEPLADLDGPVSLVIHHEPENDAVKFGEPADFVAMQRSALQRAEQAGPNITVVPVVSAWSFEESASRQPAAWNVTDAPVYGLDLYNPWSTTNGADWIEFADRLSPVMSQVQGRPILVGEYGCRSDPSQPGRAAAWMDDAFATALDANVMAMSYFNSHRNSADGTWELDEETLPAFTRILQGDSVARI